MALEEASRKEAEVRVVEESKNVKGDKKVVAGKRRRGESGSPPTPGMFVAFLLLMIARRSERLGADMHAAMRRKLKAVKERKMG